MPRSILYLLSSILSLSVPALAADWPQWGRDNSRNMVSPETALPEIWDPGKPNPEGPLDLSQTKNVKWAARLGSYTYGNPVVAAGRVFVGTNNEPPRDPRFKDDYSILLCLDEQTGKKLWQLSIPKLEAGKVSDYDATGLCSSPTVDGDRAYLVTNRCEVICIDVHGQANGNDGPFTDEAQYQAGKKNPPILLTPTDGDIIWRYDLRDELGVFPLHMTSSSVLVVGDKLYVTTSNGNDWTALHIPSPNSPALICLDKKTGQLLAQESSGISKRTLLCNWSSPSLANINGKDLIIFGAGDGFCYAFDENLKEIWRCDVNSPQQRKAKYGAQNGPSEIIATPVLYKNRVYVSVGQNPEQGDGAGSLACIDATKTGDLTSTGKLWSCPKIGRSISTVAIANDLLLAADFDGKLHCLNPDTGEIYWAHDTEARIWGSPLMADGKIYLGNEQGDLTILAATREKKVITKINF
ncbi:MAG TPA: PQQ-binding-like beta-propeller repeat protein, partial [Tepidisphaeraceae bacterium]|nr:PQQ-binding-like beta-propeller repeat protein [Tepidisphaeraceae bacterium]